MHSSGAAKRKCRRCKLDRERKRVAERAVGIREAAVERVVLVARGSDDHPPVAGKDLHLDHRLVRHAVAQ